MTDPCSSSHHSGPQFCPAVLPGMQLQSWLCEARDKRRGPHLQELLGEWGAGETGDSAPEAGMRGTKRRVRTHEDYLTLQVLGTLDRGAL